MDYTKYVPNGFCMPEGRVETARLIMGLTGDVEAFDFPLWRAAWDGTLRVGHLFPGGRVPLRLLKRTEPPTALMIGCNRHHPALPTATAADFPQLKRLLAWARVIIVNGALSHPDDYAFAARLGRQYRRVLMIETKAVFENEWQELVGAEDYRRGAHDPLLSVLVMGRPDGEYLLFGSDDDIQSVVQ